MFTSRHPKQTHRPTQKPHFQLKIATRPPIFQPNKPTASVPNLPPSAYTQSYVLLPHLHPPPLPEPPLVVRRRPPAAQTQTPPPRPHPLRLLRLPRTHP